MMFHLSLTKRIWLSFILLILIVGVIIAVIYPLSLHQTLREDSFQLIEQEQMRYVLSEGDEYNIPKSDIGFIERQAAARSVGHLLIVNGRGKLEGDPVPKSVLTKMADNAAKQRNEIGRYDLKYKGATLFYVVRKIHLEPNSAYLISYMWDTYRNQMVDKLWKRLLWILLIAGVIGLGLAAWLARYLQQPLNALGHRIEEIAKLNWRQPVVWKSGDEFQKLYSQLEHMRQNLHHYDESQKNFIQQASHELKTPIMIIQSYAQSAKDGLYPQGSLQDTMDVIISESDQMEKRVRKLLYFARVDSLREVMPDRHLIKFKEVADTVRERFSGHNQQIQIRVAGGETELFVDEEQWQIVLENMVENALRYAENTIVLSARSIDEGVEVTVYNDGELIPESQLATLFEPFHKGAKGQFGLGLVIVKRIIERHNGTISASNEKDGVAFLMTIPSEK